jgi:hypothetical protein
MAVKGLKVNSLNMSDDVSGLVLLNTTSFSAVASQSINDVFSTTYDNYLVIIYGQVVTGSHDITLRLRVGGADASGSNYSYSSFYVAVGASGLDQNSGSATSYASGIRANTTGTINEVFISNPFKTSPTNFMARLTDASNYRFGGGGHSLSNSYTGFTITTPSSTFTSSIISVYGLAK